MYRRLTLLAALALISAPPAQQAPLSAPSGYLFAMELTDTTVLAEAFAKTAVGAMLDDEELASLVEDVEKRLDAKTTEAKALQALLAEYDVDADLDQQVETLLNEVSEVAGLGHARMWFFAPDEEIDAPSIIVSVQVDDSHAAEYAKIYDKAIALMQESDELDKGVEIPAVHGHEVHSFVDASSQDSAETVWFLKASNQYLIGLNAVEHTANLRQEEPGLKASRDKVLGEGGGFVLRWDIPATLAFAEQDTDEEERKTRRKHLEVAGVAGMKSLTYGITMEGANFRETCFVEYPEEPTGWLKILAGNKGVAATMTPPEPALLQVFGNLDIQAVVDLAEKTAAVDSEGEEEPAADDESSLMEKMDLKAADFTAAFTGGYSFSVSSPGLGSLIPRLCLAVSLRDTKAYDSLRKKMEDGLEGIAFEDREFQGVTWTSIKIPNNPSPMIPTMAVWDDTLFITDTPQTLKTLIRGRKNKPDDAAEANAGKSPPALPHGMESGAVRFDYHTGEIFELIWERYLPLVQLGISQVADTDGSREPLIDLDDLPGADVIAPHLGAGTGAFAVGPDGIWMSAVSPLGNPLTAGFASVYAGPGVFLMGMGMDQSLAQLEAKVCEARLESVMSALKLHRTSFGAGKRFPSDLGALMSRGLIDDESVFTVPSDKEQHTFEYEDEDGEIIEVSSSYKYLPNGKLTVKESDLRHVDVSFEGAPFLYTMFDDEEEGDEKTKTVLLYEARRSSHQGRFVLFTDGTIKHFTEPKFEELIRQKVK